jgi:hypothetical protein
VFEVIVQFVAVIEVPTAETAPPFCDAKLLVMRQSTAKMVE